MEREIRARHQRVGRGENGRSEHDIRGSAGVETGDQSMTSEVGLSQAEVPRQVMHWG